jgi:hypothetical protein
MRVASAVFLMIAMAVHPTLAAEEGEDAEAEVESWLGCWTRSYDPAHLAKHPGQLVTAMTVIIDERTAKGSEDPGDYGARVAANLRDKSETYTTFDPARCVAREGTPQRLQCFLDGFFLGRFSLERAGKSMKLALQGGQDQIALVPGVEIESVAVLSPDNPEHALFLLHPIEAKACGE